MDPFFYHLKEMKYNDFLKILNDSKKLLIFLQYSGFVCQQMDSDELFCLYCGNSKLVLSQFNQIFIKKRYYCNLCKRNFTIQSLTELKKVRLNKFLEVCAGFISNKKISMITRDSSLNEKTVYKYIKMIKMKIHEKYNTSKFCIGGLNKIIEIDESHLFKRKYNRGFILAYEHVWIFGMIDRSSKDVYCERVLRRDAETLFNVVFSHVLPGTIINCDGWRGYSNIGRIFELNVVNHKYYFVDPEDSKIHTNNVERMWRSLKEDIRGLNIEYLDYGLKVFMFKNNILKGNFMENMKILLSLFK